MAKDLRTILHMPNVESTVVDALVSARIGQGVFRASVLNLWGSRCAVSGSSTLDAITASHIKPWKHSTDQERLYPANGLPLLANFHALFDAGLISFESSGRMIVSPAMHDSERELLGVTGKSLREEMTGRTVGYLKYHRDNIFRK